MTERRLVVVGVPQEKRTLALRRAAERGGYACELVPWLTALAAPECLAAVGRPGDALRVDSPGSDPDVWRALAGEQWALGEWRPGRAWFAGLTRCLAEFDRHTPHLRATHPSEHVLAMTDKVACQERLVAAGVPVPTALGSPCDPAELRAAMATRRWHAVYVKPRWGSSGAGVMAYRWNGAREVLATTAELAGARLLNRKRLRYYRARAAIDVLLGTVLRDGAIVQRWIPKAGGADGPFDVRAVVIRGRVTHAIARMGRGPITNLHLDAQRVVLAEVTRRFGAGAHQALCAASERAAACFPGHQVVGVDLLLDPRGRVFVVECNAWGDYLPGLAVDGLDTYDVYLRGLFNDPVPEAVA